MKPVLAIVLLLSISVYSHAQIDEKIIRQSTDEFMEAMTAWADLKPFISIDFLKEKNVGDKKINLFMVDKYTIVKIENALATVEIDHGKGQFCTRIALAFVKDSDDQVRILPLMLPLMKRSLIRGRRGSGYAIRSNASIVAHCQSDIE